MATSTDPQQAIKDLTPKAYATLAYENTKDCVNNQITGIFWTQDAANAVGYKRLKDAFPNPLRSRGWLCRQVDVTELLLTMPAELRRLVCHAAGEESVAPANVETEEETPTTFETSLAQLVSAVAEIRKMFGDAPFVTNLIGRVTAVEQTSRQTRTERDQAKARLASFKSNLRSVIGPILDT